MNPEFPVVVCWFLLTISMKISKFSFTGLLQYIWMRLRGKRLLVGGRCENCGSCCKKLSLEGGSGWLRSMDEWDEIREEFPEYQRFLSVGRDEQGFLIFTCSWCTEEGFCEDYENRLDVCKNFPEKSLKFCGGKVPESCGYFFKFVKPFDEILSIEMKNYQKK